MTLKPRQDAPEHCELCARATALTRHHLIPKTRHRNRRNKRSFSREEVKTRILWVCRPCHSHVHKCLTEKELEREFNTRAALLAHPPIQRFIEWIKTKPATFRPPS